MQKKINDTTVVLRDSSQRETLFTRKRIGSTTFLISVHSCNIGKETAEDKIIRLIEREVSRSA
jgi:hypothetical protein